MNKTESAFQNFLDEFSPEYVSLAKAAQLATWNAYTRVSDENAAKAAIANADCRIFFSDRKKYEILCAFQKNGEVKDLALKRILEVLILGFKGNMLPMDLINEISEKEADLEKVFNQFRAELDGRQIKNNDIVEILKNENDADRRILAWQASKQIGPVIAPLLAELVALRNRAARMLGFKNYFEMSYILNELNPDEVVRTFMELVRRSAGAFDSLKNEIDYSLCRRFNVENYKLGSWAWADPFGQENPLLTGVNPDPLFADKNVVTAAVNFYESIGIDVKGIVERSDLFERENKSQHAYCFDIDQEGDVRILANVRSDLHWLQTMSHELGHGAYDISISKELPWLLKNPAHTLTTEGAAMFFEQTIAQSTILRKIFGFGKEIDPILAAMEKDVVQHRLIFSRWATVVTLFEKEMYENPEQDLQGLWWNLVQTYQKITPPAGREHMADYATKTHISTSPCYYQNYLLADILISLKRNYLAEKTGTKEMFGNKKAGELLQKNFFGPGSLYHWKELTERAFGKPFGIDDWVTEVSTYKN